MPKENQTPKMFEPQEKNPEKMLPAGKTNAALKLLYILILNAVVFGAVFATTSIFFRQESFVSKIVAEIVTILSLIVSLIYYLAKREK